ncbi:hypothetical protein Hypma_014621 [Hypsizygus marmoreus]|uniref:CxC2-like cysteine cluster KDZ transposase-associated domain-containing protein n=1 Tax=Hypsizygus marmoreus TaxID=39966 RepID=A0A369JC23_HYPMA|nr:hypothetical protein Hypma_014621 [Hypsizygus marmoreus]
MVTAYSPNLKESSRIVPPFSEPTTSSPLEEASQHADADVPPSKPQGASVFMEEFLLFFPTCLDHILANFIIGDVTGIHMTKVVFCACIGVDTTDRVQPLLKSKIFPATVKCPALGFTFNLLCDFHLQTLTSKKSPFNYMEAIHCKSNNAFLKDVSDPYQQFLKIQHIWHVLALLKCRFNVPDEQWSLDDEEFWHINMLYLMEDSHFGLHQFAKPGVYDPNDTSLIPGQGLFPDDETYNNFVRTHIATSEEVFISLILMLVLAKQCRVGDRNPHVLNSMQ